MRIDQLQPETQVVLRFHTGHLGSQAHDEDATFLGLEGEGPERRARFMQDFGEWEAYRYNGHWAYGTSADRLQLLEVKG